MVFSHPSEKYAQVKLDHFPKDLGGNKTDLSCHQLVLLESCRFLLHLIICLFWDKFWWGSMGRKWREGDGKLRICSWCLRAMILNFMIPNTTFHGSLMVFWLFLDNPQGTVLLSMMCHFSPCKIDFDLHFPTFGCFQTLQRLPTPIETPGWSRILLQHIAVL